MKHKIVIVPVVDGAGNFLMIRRSGFDDNAGKWESPAGHIDPGENPPVAGVREVREETGLDVYLLPYHITIPTKKGPAAYYLATVGMRAGHRPVKPKVTIHPDEHDAYLWVPSSRLDEVKPTHKNTREHLARLFTLIRKKMGLRTRKKESSMKRRRVAEQSEIQPARYMRKMPGPGEELKEAILVGDDVEIFLQKHIGKYETPEPSISGVVERRDRNTLWIRDFTEDEEGSRPVNWEDRGSWAFVRVYRDGEGVVCYSNGNPYDPDGEEVANAKGIGLILESDPPPNYESVWAIMRGETPDLDKTIGQAPMSLDKVAPFTRPKAGVPPILHQVREVLRGYGMEPDVVDAMGSERVLILTQDGDLKRDIKKVLKDHGKEITSGRLGGLVVRDRVAQGTTTIPIATDDDLMILSLAQRRRKEKRQSAVPVAPSTLTPTGPGNQAGGLPQQTINFPSTDDQIAAMEQKIGPVDKDRGPGGVTQVTFRTPIQQQKFDMMQLSNPNKVSSRARQALARRLQQDLYREDFDAAGRSLDGLLGSGVRESSILRAPFASQQTWANFSRYLESTGEIRGSRLARNAARFARDR